MRKRVLYVSIACMIRTGSVPLQAAPEILQIELQVGPVVGLPHILVASVRRAVLSGMVGLPDTVRYQYRNINSGS